MDCGKIGKKVRWRRGRGEVQFFDILNLRSFYAMSPKSDKRWISELEIEMQSLEVYG